MKELACEVGFSRIPEAWKFSFSSIRSISIMSFHFKILYAIPYAFDEPEAAIFMTHFIPRGFIDKYIPCSFDSITDFANCRNGRITEGQSVIDDQILSTSYRSGERSTSGNSHTSSPPLCQERLRQPGQFVEVPMIGHNYGF
ncbi:hypothetical protein TNCV_687611 [Trichonephila clavipes]|nr:hypothetical protein TNCV_687611 [Trichonephila clavipes]